MARPTILLVEDLADIRDDLALQFHNKGAHVLTAASAKEAYGIFQKRASDVAALVTDIRLDEGDARDRGGVSLARQVSEIVPGIPRIGVTAYDSSVGQGELDEVYEKKTPRAPRSIYRHIESIIARAAQFDETRYLEVPATLMKLREKYRISAEDFATLISSRRVTDLGRVALLSWHDAQAASAGPSARFDENGVLPAAGSREIRVLPAGLGVIGDISLESDVGIVLRPTSDGMIAQLFGMPLVFTYGDTEQEAISALLEHLYECYSDMGDLSDFAGSNLSDVVRFHTFLSSLFTQDAKFDENDDEDD